jgi:hypothetical protein
MRNIIEVVEVGLQGVAGPPGEIDAEAAAVAVAEYLQQHGLTVSWGNLTGDISNQADLMEYAGGDYADFYQLQKTLNGGTP